MKTIKIIISTLLSLLLALCILCTGLLFISSKIFREQELRTVLSETAAGEKILNYEYLPEEGGSADIYEQLAQAIETQVALAVNVSGKEAAVCQNGAFDHIKELQDETYAYTDFDSLAEDLAEGYVQTAIAENIIRPDKTISYMDAWRKRVYVKADTLLKDTVTVKYKTILEKLKEEDFFCGLNIDQKDAFAYLMCSGKQAAAAQNGLYRRIEAKVGSIFDQHFLAYIRCLKQQDDSYSQIAQQTLNETLLAEAYSYIDDLNISQEKLNTEKADAVLLSGIAAYVAPKLYPCLPSYKDTLSAAGTKIMSLIAMALNGKMTYICLSAAALLAILLLLIGKGKAFFFIGLSLLFSGAAAFFAKTYSVKLTDALSTAMEKTGNDLSFLLPGFIKVFLERLSSLGIYALILAVIFLSAALLLRKKSQKAL
ncbi:MAG: hypothetical protein K5648_02575 [Erysipelotrichaceae bacterium]|nr:hypothetical protein [Erysipelotrichaceae bacterium]